VAQLAIYAFALAKHTGILLFDFKCTWFDEQRYCKFFPRQLLSGSQ
jgi:hypothetical protein